MSGVRALTKAEIKEIKDSFTGRYALRNLTMFILMIKSGFRISEILSLKVKDVFRNGQMTNSIEVERKNMKGKKSGRVVPFHPEAKNSIQAWLLERGNPQPEQFLFKSQKGENSPIQRAQAYRILKACYIACGLLGKLGCHSTRKHFAEAIFPLLGKDLLKLKVALGHRSIDSTIRYIAVSQKEVDEAALRL